MPRNRGAGAARLVSTPSRETLAGLARDSHLTGFPEFEQFYAAGFPAGTQARISPVRLPFRHARIRAGLKTDELSRQAQ